MERYQELLNAFDVQVIDNHEFVQDNLTISQKLVIELQNYLGLSESKGASDAPCCSFLKSTLKRASPRCLICKPLCLTPLKGGFISA